MLSQADSFPGAQLQGMYNRHCPQTNFAHPENVISTVNSPSNGHFGARPTVRYSDGVLYWGIIVVTTFHVPCSKFLANIGYMDHLNISQGCESISLVKKELI